jgi:hypothetical protein
VCRVGTHAQMKIIGILRSLNDEAGAGTKILTASSIQSTTIVFNMTSTSLFHVSGWISFFCMSAQRIGFT